MDIKELFLKGCWSFIVSENDTEWVRKHVNSADEYNTAPCGDLGVIIKEMTDLGLNDKIITRFTKIIQFQLLAKLCYFA